MIIDIHTHIGRLPDSPFAKTSFKQNLESLLKEMKKSGVGHVFVLPVPVESKTDPSPDIVIKLIL